MELQPDLPNEADHELIEKIDKADIVPLNDPTCEHVWRILPGDSGIDGHTAIGCAHCPIGHIIENGSLSALNLPTL